MKYVVYYLKNKLMYDIDAARTPLLSFDTLEEANRYIKIRAAEMKESTASYHAHPESSDNVESPVHYTRLSPEPVNVIVSWGLDFPTGSAVKYLARAGHKTGAAEIDDLRKAISFINHKIRLLEKK